MIGQILGNRYRILREIGMGGMAKVYVAEDMNQGQLAAVKILYPQFGQDIAYIQRFIREAKLAESLDDPHIVKIQDYGSSRDIHYLVLEYVEGQDLRAILDERGPFSWPEALKVIDQVCQALEEANAHHIIHRDIKPQNIMITSDDLVKVLDFGVARSRSLPSITQSGFVGSPYYISPEQAMGEEVDIRSDIYSTGIVLYELLSGQVPFDAKSHWSIISQHIAEELPQIELDGQAISTTVYRLLRAMVAKNPADRFQDPAALRQAIDTVLAGRDLPEALATPSAQDTDQEAKVGELYEQAMTALKREQWQRGINLLNQVLELQPDHAEALTERSQAGIQARLTALYSAAIQAMETNHWQEALDELTDILEIDPDYKDCAELQGQAKEALTKGHLDLRLSELYGRAMAYFEAKDYQTAEDLFGQIREVAPTYRRVEALWAESRRRKTGGEVGQVNQEQGQNTPAVAKPAVPKVPVKWLVATIAVIIAIVGGVWVVGVNDTGPTTPSEPAVDALLAQAQTAFVEDDRALAASLLKQILSIEPTNETALALQSQLDAQIALNQQLSQAMAAVVAEDWTEAIEILRILQAQVDFEPDTVASLLCDAHLGRGEERLTGITSPRDQATVRAALIDFQAGQTVCANHDDLNIQLALVTEYLAALDEAATVETKIQRLQSIVLAEPGYAAGQAAQNLYLAYLNRGDLFRAQGNLAAALADYTAALNLPVTDLSEARRKQALASVSPTATPSPTKPADDPSTAEPTIEITPTTPTLEATVESTPASDFIYAAPILLQPDTQQSYTGQFAEIILSWQALDLPSDAYYDVTIRYFVGQEARYWGSPVTGNSWQVPVEAGYGQAGQDEFSWWVTVRRAGTHEPLSPASEERVFFWRPG